MTFFPWPGAFKGRIGTGQLTVTFFAVPEKSLPYWRERLRKCGVEFDEATSDFGEELLFLRDPDGLQLELGRIAERFRRRSKPLRPAHSMPTLRLVAAQRRSLVL